MMSTLHSLSCTPGAQQSLSKHNPSARSPRLLALRWLAVVSGLLLTLPLPLPVIAQPQPKATGAAQLPASASPTPSAVLLSTAGGHASARALDSVIGAALDDLKVVNVAARPGLDLGAVQLALDCVAENPQCLRMVTTQHEVDVLVAPTLSRISNELVLTLLRFDARSGKTQRVLKRQTGQTLSSETLDAVPDLMRELFGLPPKPKVEPPVAAATTDEHAADSSGLHAMEPMPEPPMEAPTASRSVPVGPLLLGGGGVLLLGAGLVVGLTVLSAQDNYESLTTNTRGIPANQAEDVINRANDYKNTGQTNAVISSIFLGVGSAVVVAAGIWLAVDLTSKKSSQYDDHVHLTPLLGAHEVGLVLTQRGAGL